MSQEPVIQTDSLSKVYRHPLFFWQVRARALTELDLTVRRGEVFGLLGPNGSGKSTTIKLILGLIFPTAGHVAIFGRRPTETHIKQRIGFLPEESYLYRFLTAEETLDFYGRLFNLPPAERARRIDALLEMVGLRHERRRPVVEFSKGMQRRIGIAQALINDPELVILDEPTTGLDPIGTREVKDLILQLKAKGKTVLLSSHLLADVEDVCDRISILYGGRVQASGTVEEVLRNEAATQITAEMDEATVQEVVELIRRRRGAETPVQVHPPVERLEQFFLRIVHDAQNRQVATSGVQRSTGKLDFLTDFQGEGSLLATLTREASLPAAVSAAAPATAPTLLEQRPGAQSEMLARLATPAVAENDAPRDEAAVVEAPAAPQQADADLLGRLVQGEE